MDPFDLRLWSRFNQSEEPSVIDQVAIDTRRIEGGNSLFVALPGSRTDGHLYLRHAEEAGARFALVKKGTRYHSPSGRMKLLFVDNPLLAMQEIAAAYRNQLKIKIVGITGSYGKTMVKDLLQELLKKKYKTAASPESFNSQIGVALSLFTLKKEHEIGLIEAAVSKAGEMDRLAQMIRPDYGIMTQIGVKHVETLGDLSKLSWELFRLFDTSPNLQWALIPHFNKPLNASEDLFQSWDIREHDHPHAERIEGPRELSLPYQIDFPQSEPYRGMISSGFYYYLDLLNMTVKSAWKLGIDPASIKETLNRYILEPIRTEIWKSPLGATFINESYSEDIQSLDRAFKFLKDTTDKGRKVVLFGGFKGTQAASSYRQAGKLLAAHKTDLVCLIGHHPFKPLIDTLKLERPKAKIITAADYKEALIQFKDMMRPGDIVLVKGEKKEPLDELTESFHESLCSNICLVNLASIAHNIKALRMKLEPGTRIMVMVKALAYGTDDYRIAKFLSTCGIDILGVSYVDEGVALKRGGVTQSIFVLNAAEYEVTKVVKWDLEVAVGSIAMIDLLAEEAKRQQKNLKVHLHIDTGMSRFGCRPKEAVKLAERILSHPSLTLEGVMTHFTSSDNPAEDAITLHQAKLLENLIVELGNRGIEVPWKHAANSAAALRFTFPSFNMVRVGLAVYGLYPSQAARQTLKLKLAISLISRIVGINQCGKGDTVSYGRTYVVQKDLQKIAVLPIGYFDGLHRNYSGCAHVLIRGEKAPMVGRICMDFMMVDITDIPSAKCGDPVLIFGEDEFGDYISPEDLAEKGDSIIHELITCLGPRIQRVFIYEESQEKQHVSK